MKKISFLIGIGLLLISHSTWAQNSNVPTNLHFSTYENNIGVLWDAPQNMPPSGNAYAVFIKKGSDFTESDLAVGITPMYVPLGTTQYTFKDLSKDIYYFKVAIGVFKDNVAASHNNSWESYGNYSETAKWNLIGVKEVTGRVKCGFTGSNRKEKCYSEKASCSGLDSCVTEVKGQPGERITWKSSCGGYAYTSLEEGNLQYAIFQCSAGSASSTTPSTCVRSNIPNAGSSGLLQTCTGTTVHFPSTEMIMTVTSFNENYVDVDFADAIINSARLYKQKPQTVTASNGMVFTFTYSTLTQNGAYIDFSSSTSTAAPATTSTTAFGGCIAPYVLFRGSCVDPIPPCNNPPKNFMPSSCIDKIEKGVLIERYNFQCLPGYSVEGKECVKTDMEPGNEDIAEETEINGLPDLVISDQRIVMVRLKMASGKYKKAYKVFLQITNNGEADVEEPIHFSASNKNSSRKRILASRNGLEAGKNIRTFIYVELKDKDTEYVFTVDPSSEIEESNENNNSWTRVINTRG